MSASSVIIKFDAQDNLTPELKKQIETLKQLRDKYDALDLKIKDLKADKKGILAGTIVSDIEDIKRLQIEIAKLKEAYKTASRGEKTAAKNALKAKQIELDSKLTRTINRQTITLKNYKDQLDYTSKALEREYLQKKKVENASKKENITTQKLINTKRKENAVRRSTVNAIIRHLRQVETLVLAYYAVGRVIDMTIKRGINLNKTIEDGTVGIAALIAANTAGGNSAERFSAAMAISSNTMIALKKASVETAATFPQLTEVFQQAIGGALGAGQAMGKSVDEIVKHTIKLSQRMTNIASSIGMPMEQVSQEIRAIMEGTITKDARIAKMLGITTKDIDEAKKSADGLFKYLEKKLEVFDVLADQMTLGRAVARFTDALDTIRMEATKPIFDDLKYEVIDVTKELKARTKEWENDIITFYFSAKANFGNLSDTFNILVDDIYIVSNALDMLGDSILTGKIANGLNIFKIGLLGIDVILETLRTGFKDFEYIISISTQKIKEYIIDVQIMFEKLEKSISLIKSKIFFDSLDEKESKAKYYDDKIESLKKAKKELIAAYKPPSNLVDNGDKWLVNLMNHINNLKTNTKELSRAYKEVYSISSMDFNSVSDMADYITKIVEKYKEYPEILSTLGHEVEKQITKIGNKTKLELKITALQKTKLAEEISIAKKLNTTLSDQFNLWKKIKTVSTNPSYNSDYSTYYKNLFDKIGYSIKAYDKAVELYKKLMSKATTASEKNAIEKIFGLKIKNLNEWIKLNYKAAKEIPTIWDNISKSMAESMESNFFDEITGKFKSFKEFMRSLFRDLASSIINPFAHQLSRGLTNSIMGMFGGGLPQTTKKLTKQNAINLGLKVLGNGVYQDSSGNKIVTDTLGNVTRAYNNKGNVVSDVKALKSIATLPSTIKTGASFFTNPSAALTGMLYAPSAYLGQAAGALYGTGYTGAGSFLAGGANFFGGGLATGLHGAALAGQLGAAVGVGGLGGYLFGTLGDKLLGADTYAGLGGALGGVAGGVAGSLGAFTSLGSAAGPLGALIGAVAGSLLGGLFGKTKVTGQVKGIEFLNDISKDNIDGRDYLTTYYKKKSWLHTKKWSSTKYQDFNDTEINAIQQVITNYDYLLTQLGKSAEIVISTGKYSSIEDFLSTGATKAFIKEATTADLDKVYKAWKDYAKAVNKKVYEAFAEEINNYIKDIRNWKMWLYGRQGDTLEALKYKANYLESDFENLAKTFGLIGVTVDNFAQKYQEAISKNLTPNEIKKWEALGNALKSATDAADALRNATLKQFDSEAKYKEYMASLDKQVQLQHQAQLQAQLQLQQNWIDFVTNLTDVFHNLKNTAQSFIDSLHDTNSAQSYTFFAKRYNDVKAQITKDLQSNNYKALQEDFSVYTSVASSLKSSVLSLKNPELYNKVSKTILEDATKYRDLFNESESITGAIAKSNDYLKDIASYTKDTKKHTDTLTQGGGIVAAIQSLKDPSLTTAINNLISYLSAKHIATTNGSSTTTTNSNPTFGPATTGSSTTTVSTAINPDSLTLGNFISNENKPKYITAFSKLEGIKTKNELDEDINLLNTYYYTDINKRADYIKNLTGNTKNKLKTLLQSLKGLTDDIAKSFESSSNTNVVAAISNTAKGVGISNAQFFTIYKTDVEKMQKVAELYNNKKISTLEYANDLNYYAAMLLQDVGNPANLTGNALDTYNKMVDYYKSTKVSVKNLGGIPKYAEGGVVTKPTLGLIGEAGYPEAVIPMKNGRDIPVKIDNSGMEQKLNDLVVLTEQQANEIRKMRKEIQDMNERSAA